jgi:hypothetical protein
VKSLRGLEAYNLVTATIEFILFSLQALSGMVPLLKGVDEAMVYEDVDC